MRTITPPANSSNSDVISSSRKTATWLARPPYRMMKTTAPHRSALIFLLLFAASTPLAASSGTPPPYAVPSFSSAELRNPSDGSLARLLAALSSSGVIAIEIGALAAGHPADPLCDLFQSCAASSVRADRGDSILTEDVGGGAVRTTIATATRGLQDRHPLDAGDLSLHARAYCGTEGADGRAAVSNMDGARRAVSDAVGSHLLPAMDRLLADARGGGAGPLLVERGKAPAEHFSLRSVVSSAENLEHFRVYSSPPEDGGPDDDTLRGHTDGGLFLAFLPGRSCDGHDWDDLSLLVEVGGKMRQAVFPAPADGGSVVGIMMGEGMESWLNYNGASPFRATKHAVKMRRGSRRVWYGMMFLVPPDTVVQKKPVVRTFAQIRESVGRGGDDDRNSVGCNRGPFRPDDAPINTMRRVSAGHQDPSVCNNSTNFYCWMTCQNLPEADHKDALINAGNSLYCADPAIVDYQDLSKGVSACTQGGVVGGAMDAACVGIWKPAEPGVPTYIIEGIEGGDSGLPNDEAPYCYGGTSMYMHGFEWEASTCVVYLFKGLVITSRIAFVFTCLGTVLLGVCFEWLVFGRRKATAASAQWKSKILRTGASASMYGVQLAAGYALMLVIMTYSGPLVCSVVLGLSIGHFWVAWDQENDVVVAGGTPCCSNFLATPNTDQNSRGTVGTAPISRIDLENDEEDYNCCSGQDN
eukprot:CAMPEP_0194291826 /NCGR_PEP_ID=MMETSP0169-20130528/44267_1 /TAXON_ID=218684 /ORGANISM="Corethron pennatum, Strain L29A3" /LENGTH=696 /DNA_ID=CAMNT_0039039827 /DNA_START=202 /DNA_END=2289 /DNA_ORIENTATION=+